jgi:TPR repeat protein
MNNHVLYENGVQAFNNGNIALAKEIWESLALNGDADAQIKMGDLYFRDPGLTKDHAEALFWYRKAAAQRNAQGLLMIGYFFQHGLGVDQNLDQAIEWYKKAAEFDSAKACFNLGIIYNNRLIKMAPFTFGNQEDALEAVAWFLTGAELGHPESQSMIGLQYCGVGHLKEDFGKALHWLRLAAPKVPEAMGALANLYAHGKGVLVNKKIAFVLYRLAFISEKYQQSAAGQSSINDYEILMASMSEEEIELGMQQYHSIKNEKNALETLGI